MVKTALIMAGGRGERFWPKSRKNLPKQFLSLTSDGKTMIQLTVERISPVVSLENIYISTNTSYKKLVMEQLPGIPEENILCEPVGRNTAPCIGLAAVHIRKKLGDAIMMVLPSDHLIKNNVMFLDVLRDAATAAEENTNLVTIGITPSYPETGYGYIQFDSQNLKECTSRAYKVVNFKEKPDLSTAKEYVASGDYLWNSGMFIWKVSSILSNMENLMPAMYDGLKKIESSIGTTDQEQVLESEFINFKSESIDYGIMEHAKDIYIIPGAFGWDDVGSWLALERINSTNEFGNVVNGNVISIDTKNSIIHGNEKLIATVGLKDIIIIDTEDALLICDKDSTQDIKKVIENLKICNRNEYI